VSMRPHHVGIVTSDLDRSKAFYGALGFEAVQELGDADKVIVFMDLGGFQVELFWYRETPPAVTAAGRVLGFRHLALRTDDIDEELARLRAAGIVGEDATIRDVLPGGWRLLFFHDPDGVEIEVMQEP
jgi:catechol 2,3-dioxygenase-like lactoylglutathione lyase family enzyme